MSMRLYRHPARDVLSGADPNAFPEPLTDEHRAAVNVTCRFLGREFSEGDEICYQNGKWVCKAEGWVATGKSC